MNLNKKGFTLVELLAAIIIIGLLMAIAVPSSITISNKIKERMLDTKLNLAVQQTKIWAQDNIDCFTHGCAALDQCYFGEGETRCIITLNKLAELKLLDYDQDNKILSPVDNEDIGSTEILIKYQNYRDIITTKLYDDEEREYDSGW